MGRFERKIQKKLKSEVENFDVWFEKNQDKLPGFANNTTTEKEQKSDVKVKTRKAWLIPAAFLFAAICIVLCFLPLMLGDGSDLPQTPAHFGDEAVYEAAMDQTDQQTILQDNPFLSKLTYTDGAKLLKTEDDSLVFAVMSGEFETVTDYYFVTVQIEYNSYYDFLSKQSYESLQQRTEINGYSVQYDLLGLDADELNWYRMLTEKNGQKIYWEIHCFEESITEFIDLILG